MKDKGYTVDHHEPDDSTGFSATVFQKDGAAILAIRDTDDVKDISADSELVSGLPYQQFESLASTFLC
jgi:hypothetical protein